MRNFEDTERDRAQEHEAKNKYTKAQAKKLKRTRARDGHNTTSEGSSPLVLTVSSRGVDKCDLMSG